MAMITSCDLGAGVISEESKFIDTFFERLGAHQEIFN